ncbi:MAG: hypothetical protein Q8P50_11330, partial [Bacillota bacterium]|nr:hypothetical protein [Bacillota bacterium]
VRGGARRSRGANFTSTDAAVRFRQADGTIRIVLIEWKYTESYGPDNKAEGKSGPTRVAIYRPFFMKPNCPIQRSLVSSFDDLFVEPFYQLMRQQLLAKEMEQAGELSADIVSVLHLAPDVNGDFRRVKSPGLGGLASTATGVWSVLVPDPQAFLSRSVEDVFGHFPIGHYPALQDWWDYIAERYPWTI